MALEAQQHHLLSDLAGDHDLRDRSADDQLRLLVAAQSAANLGYPQILSGTVFSNGQQNSGLTAVSRKRVRGNDDCALPIHLPQHHYYNNNNNNNNNSSVGADRLFDNRVENSFSGMTSTSGRSTGCSTDAAGGIDLISSLYHQNLEVDALVRLQSQRLRSGIEEANKRHCRALISAVERQIQKRLVEKDSEIERARTRNSELEEKLKQALAESQLWFGVARNNEAVVASLRSTLGQVLLQQKTVEEGFGESESESCCFNGDDGRWTQGTSTCRGCDRKGGAAQVCVLLLPCRHLCLCKACESATDTCPVCNTPRTASLEVLLPPPM